MAKQSFLGRWLAPFFVLTLICLSTFCVEWLNLGNMRAAVNVCLYHVHQLRYCCSLFHLSISNVLQNRICNTKVHGFYTTCVKRKRANFVLSSFFYRSIDCWNLLSLTLKQSKSLNVFKYYLNSFDLTEFLKGSASTMS